MPPIRDLDKSQKVGFICAFCDFSGCILLQCTQCISRPYHYGFAWQLPGYEIDKWWRAACAKTAHPASQPIQIFHAHGRQSARDPGSFRAPELSSSTFPQHDSHAALLLGVSHQPLAGTAK
jgi:hypothetical protein